MATASLSDTMKKFDAMIRSDLSPRDQAEDGGSDEGYEEQRTFQPRVCVYLDTRVAHTLETTPTCALAAHGHIVQPARRDKSPPHLARGRSSAYAYTRRQLSAYFNIFSLVSFATERMLDP